MAPCLDAAEAGTNQLAELLETREVLSALTLMPDFVQETLPATAAQFPQSHSQCSCGTIPA
ncbi:MAG UNVERIFIED_CONTAM: hypothetical protein LVR18_24705 [Planctomycetaceae bacterium]